MTTRYYNKWIKAFAVAGGHDGPATVAALRPYAEQLAAAGVPSTLAGLICAQEYRSYRRIEDLTEEVAGLKLDVLDALAGKPLPSYDWMRERVDV